MSSGTKPTLGYWSIRGLGQPIKLLLAYLEIDYEVTVYELTPELTKANWWNARDKLNLDFPNLPYFIDGQNRVTESRAILKYLCRTRKPELLGSTVEVQTQLDTIDNFIYDLLWCGFVPVLYNFTEELKKQYKETEPVKLGYLSNFLKDKKFLIGDDLSYVDFFVYEVLDQLRTYDSKCLDKFPNLQAYLTRFENIPVIQKYMNSSSFMKKPLYSQQAIIKI